MSDKTVKSLLTVSHLKTHFFTEDGVVKAVDDVSFHINEGEIVGLVGESGCGKTVTSLSIIGLISKPGKVVDGEILYEGQDLLKLSYEQLSDIRGNRISMIFQQPQTSLNPVFTVGEQVAEVLQIHRGMSTKEAWEHAVEMLSQVGIPSPEKRAFAYPHELSGGQAQRVMIAMALIMKPNLLIADEPTTALDVTIQAQILDLMRGLNKKMGTAIILITHDLGVIAGIAGRVAVMYAGKIVEQSTVETLFEDPRHPYTKGLINSIPILGRVKNRLEVIPGVVPNLIDLPQGCAFAPRCEARTANGLEICAEQMPDMTPIADGHEVRCWLYTDQDKPSPKKSL
ncbi:MAG: ABC transporter ATP-binding protein [Anaerolineales bacterium]|nr:MAG: ABC transporter ATP-binding protein [Anaerolineales bacterium]